MNLLQGLEDDSQTETMDETVANSSKKIGIGMDSCITPLRHNNLSLCQTTDFFYPIIDNPYLMGKIACANVVSDLYATGVVEIDSMLMLVGISSEMTDHERDTIYPLIIKGFKDAVEAAGSVITGGETVINPWCTIGGVATSICTINDYIIPENAQVGDVLVLTKPLGVQIAVSAYTWMDQKSEKWDILKTIMSEAEVMKAYKTAVDSMTRLNKVGARLMHKYMAHAATDVTGFGILGHAQNLAKYQKNEVAFSIHNLPIIANMTAVAKLCKMSRLLKGTSPETSGGLLICLPRENAAAFCRDIQAEEKATAWIIGVVEKGNRTATIIDKPRILEVSPIDSEGTH